MAEGCSPRVYMCLLAGLSGGKAASQACHAMQQMSDKVNAALYEGCLGRDTPGYDECVMYLAWRRQPTVVCLEMSGAELMRLRGDLHGGSNPFVVEVIVDLEGDRQVEPGTVVCLGLYPSVVMQARLQHCRLFP